MSEGPANTRWFQFSIRRILAATFWIGMCFGAYCAIVNDLIMNRWEEFLSRGLLYWSPFVATGALFGRPWSGLFIGILLVTSYFLLVLMAINAGWV